MAKLEKRAWWPDLVRLKDEHSLRELARRFDVSPAAIQMALKRNGIPRKKRPAGRPVSGAASSKDPAKARGRHARRYSEMRLSPFEGQLGRLPDKSIAEKAGLSAATVARIRRSRGIDAPRPRTGGTSRSSKVAAYADLLGRVSDAEVARLAGVSRAAVRNYRVRRGIASPEKKTQSSVREAQQGDVLAWLVLGVRVPKVVVLAPTALEALRFAVARGEKPIGVKRLPRVL